MIVLSPLGILVPAAFRAGDAWGEWSPDTLKKMLGFIPEGLGAGADAWRSPIPDYNFFGEGSSLLSQSVSYIVSAAIGLAACVAVMYLLARWMRKD